MSTFGEYGDDLFSKFVERDRVVVRGAIELLNSWDEDKAKNWVKELVKTMNSRADGLENRIKIIKEKRKEFKIYDS